MKLCLQIIVLLYFVNENFQNFPEAHSPHCFMMAAFIFNWGTSPSYDSHLIHRNKEKSPTSDSNPNMTPDMDIWSNKLMTLCFTPSSDQHIILTQQVCIMLLHLATLIQKNLLMTSINDMLYDVFNLNRTARFLMVLNKNVGVSCSAVNQMLICCRLCTLCLLWYWGASAGLQWRKKKNPLCTFHFTVKINFGLKVVHSDIKTN